MGFGWPSTQAGLIAWPIKVVSTCIIRVDWVWVGLYHLQGQVTSAAGYQIYNPFKECASEKLDEKEEIKRKQMRKKERQLSLRLSWLNAEICI